MPEDIDTETGSGTGTGTPFIRVRMDKNVWLRFAQAVRRADPDANRSAVLRRFIRWYIGDIDELPRRPEPRRDPGTLGLDDT